MMSFPLRISGHRIPLSQQQGFSTFSPASISRVSSRFCSLVPTIFSPEPNKFQRLCYTNANGNDDHSHLPPQSGTSFVGMSGHDMSDVKHGQSPSVMSGSLEAIKEAMDTFMKLWIDLRKPLKKQWVANDMSSGQAYDISDVQNCSVDHEGISLEDILRLMKRLRRYGISGILSYGLLNTIYYLTTFLFVWFYVAPAPARMGYGAAVGRFLKIMAMVWAGSQVTKLVRAGGALALAPFVDRGLSWFTTKFKFESQWKAFMAIVAFCFGLAIMLFFVVTLLWA
ncbi:hypothetical protein HHK36_017035 [Tetracentron sinense]|uniref:Uncharacterized protein n=1 Tax=Tetracentron sinense TaxID=13715 RepID=A0A834Z1Y6_TETSI|nr:hypothetical protein HHK36_017035 [Tetracentron sinense]